MFFTFGAFIPLRSIVVRGLFLSEKKLARLDTFPVLNPLISIFLSPSQPLNRLFIFFKFVASNSLILRVFRVPQPSNMEEMSVTLVALKSLTSSSVNALHLKNIFFMVVTCEVSKLPKSRVVRALHPQNMPLISVTFEVMKPLKSRELEFRALQSLNICFMDVTSSVFRFLMPSMLVSFLNPLNQSMQ